MAAAVQTVPIVCTHKLDKQFFDSHTEEMVSDSFIHLTLFSRTL